ncbi:tetratricopeptide repeat protein [Thermodesulfobacteriota bacterium]
MVQNSLVHRGASALLGGVFAIWYVYLRPASAPVEVVKEEEMALPLPDKPSIAVLPFASIGGDPEQEYLSDGITEQIITNLSKHPDMFVIARNSTFTYKGKPVKVQQVSRELGVRYVLEGSLQRSGDAIRVTAQLIDATTGKNLWSESYHRGLKDIFALQDDISLKILDAMHVKLTGGVGRRAFGKGTDNLQAYLKYLHARHYFFETHASSLTKESFIQFRQLVEEAVSLEPNFSYAIAWLAFSYQWEVLQGFSESPAASLKKAFELSRRAVELDDSDPWPHITLGWLYMANWEFDKAVAEGVRAVTLAPSTHWAHRELGVFLMCADRTEKAIAEMKKALRLNPHYEVADLSWLSFAYYYDDQYEKALEVGKAILDRDPDYLPTHHLNATIYSHLGREEEARAEAKDLLRINPTFSVRWVENWPHADKQKVHRQASDLRKALESAGWSEPEQQAARIDVR